MNDLQWNIKLDQTMKVQFMESNFMVCEHLNTGRVKRNLASLGNNENGSN